MLEKFLSKIYLFPNRKRFICIIKKAPQGAFLLTYNIWRDYSSKLNTIMKLINEIQAYTYLIKCKITGQVYYGSRTKNVRLKRTPLEDLMLHYTTSSNDVNDLIKHHGIEAFDWEVRQTFDDLTKPGLWETKVLRRMKVLQRRDIWLNANIAGKKVLTKCGAKKISETHRGKPKSEEHREKIRVSNIGKNKGRIQTEEHRRKNSEANSGKNNARFGITVSEEICKKISAAKKGRSNGHEGYKETRPEVLERIKQAALARPPQSKESRELQASKTRGQKRTPEQKERIRQGILRKLAEKHKP